MESYFFPDEKEDESECETEGESNITFSELETVTRSVGEEYRTEREQWDVERAELKEKIAELEAKIKKFEEKEHRTAPLLTMYRRQKKVKNGVGITTIGDEVKRISIVLQR